MAFVGIVIMVVVLVPMLLLPFFVIKGAGRQRQLTRAYADGPSQLGFRPNGGAFEGQFQGLYAWVRPSFDLSAAGATDIAYAMIDPGSYQGNQQLGYQRYEIGVRVPGAQFPETGLYQRQPLGRLDEVEWYRNKGTAPRLPVAVPWRPGASARRGQASFLMTGGAPLWDPSKVDIEVHGVDAAFAQAICGSPELGGQAAGWPHGINLRLLGDTVTLEIIDEARSLIWAFGEREFYSWQFVAFGLAICAAAARAAMAARPAALGGGQAAYGAQAPYGGSGPYGR
jgi:hypothetical protein